MKFVRMNGENTAVFEIEESVHEIDLKVDLGLLPSKNRTAAFDGRARTNGVVSDEEWDELELAGANVPFFSNRRNPISPEEATLALSILGASIERSEELRSLPRYSKGSQARSSAGSRAVQV